MRSGQLLAGNKNADGTRLARRSFDQATRFEGEHHVVDGRGSDLEEIPHVGFSGGPAMKKRVHLDEGEVLPLKCRELVRVLQPRLPKWR